MKALHKDQGVSLRDLGQRVSVLLAGLSLLKCPSTSSACIVFADDLQDDRHLGQLTKHLERLITSLPATLVQERSLLVEIDRVLSVFPSTADVRSFREGFFEKQAAALR